MAQKSDPSSFTAEKLKKELTDRGVQLPRGNVKKDVLVELYKKHALTRPAGPASAKKIFEFSSDDDDAMENARSRKVSSV